MGSSIEDFKREWTNDFKYRLELHNNGMASVAGYGTNMNAVLPIIQELPNILKKYEIKTFLDAPCGDYYIMKLIDFTNIKYIGIDLVDEQIKRNKKEYQDIDFRVLNMFTDEIPKADLVFCRDIFIHLSTINIKTFIHNCIKSNCKYLMSSTYTRINENSELNGIVGWRLLNLENSPYNFPKPLELIQENDNVDVGKSMGIWKFCDLI